MATATEPIDDETLNVLRALAETNRTDSGQSATLLVQERTRGEPISACLADCSLSDEPVLGPCGVATYEALRARKWIYVAWRHADPNGDVLYCQLTDAGEAVLAAEEHRRDPRPRYECDGCGACCRSLLIEADALDVLREPRLLEVPTRNPLTVQELLDAEGMKSVVLNVLDRETMACHFLGADNRCAIYATRPSTCVAFPAGSPQCQSVRERMGLLPLPPAPRGRGLAVVPGPEDDE